MSQYSYQAFGSPMLGSTITTAPRRQGDGMDSEMLLRQDVETKSPPSSTQIPLASKQFGVGVNTSSEKSKMASLSPQTTKTMSIPLSKSEAEFESSLMSLAETSSQPARTIEGHQNNSLDVVKLQEQLSQLTKQLETQSKVNTDLKKLLVASMGDDLHHKVDSLIMTRAQLASDIGSYTDRISQDYETLDKLTIQADMWRSKYMASRVLVDQLAAGKDKYKDLYAQSKRALQQFLQERTQLNETLKQTFRYLKLIKDSFDPRGACQPPSTIPNILELSRTNHLLSDSIKFRLLPAMPVFAVALDAGLQNGHTPAEKLAMQVLSTDSEPENTPSPEVPGRLSASLLVKYDRFHPQVRYDNITFNCCAQCKGDIKLV